MSYNDAALSLLPALAVAGSRCFKILLRRWRESMSRANPRFHRTNPALPAAVANTFEITIYGSIEGQQTVNTFYYADGGVALASNSEALLIAAWKTANKALFLATVSQDWTMVSIKCQCLTSPTRIPVYSTENSPATGPTGHEPTTVAVTIDRLSLIKGQAGRGRISMPGVPTAWVTASSVNGTGQTFYTSFLPVLTTGFVSGAITYVALVVSRKNKSGPLLGASPVSGAVLRVVLGSCRRRKLGRGS